MEHDDSDSNKKNKREITIQTYKQIEEVGNQYVDSADDQHQNPSQGSQNGP